MIQLYISKKNFDAQKAERFFKERRVQVQVMDLKKHKLGERELQTMAKDVGMQGLLDREDKRAKEHPACYCNIDSVIMTAIQENPWLLKSPIVRRRAPKLLFPPRFREAPKIIPHSAFRSKKPPAHANHRMSRLSFIPNRVRMPPRRPHRA